MLLASPISVLTNDIGEVTMANKIKTVRGAAKRFKKTGSGKFVHRRAYRSHILTKKSQKRKRQLRANKTLPKCEEGAVRDLLR